jgi:hypothetical protein
MAGTREVHQCQCPDCRAAGDHPDQEYHHQVNLLLSRLDEQQRRWFVAIESKKLGHGGDTRMSEITGISIVTIRRGRAELEQDLKERPTDQVRLPGGGRPSFEKKHRRSCQH